jgi:hypothetical protein
MPMTVSRPRSVPKRLVTSALLRDIADLMIERIVTRTQAGQSVSGGGFQGYSESYKKQKAKYRGTGSGSPDLTLTGDMLNAVVVQTLSDRSVTIGFAHARANAKAFYNDRGGRVIRKFWGLTPKDKADIRNRVVEFLNRAIRGR